MARYLKLLLSEGQAIIREAYVSASLCQMTAEQLNAQLRAKLWDEVESKTAGTPSVGPGEAEQFGIQCRGPKPRYTQDFRSFLAGYHAHVREVFWNEQVYYAHQFEGRIYSDNYLAPDTVRPFRELQNLCDERGISIGSIPGAHLHRGTTINFTEWKVLP